MTAITLPAAAPVAPRPVTAPSVTARTDADLPEIGARVALVVDDAYLTNYLHSPSGSHGSVVGVIAGSAHTKTTVQVRLDRAMIAGTVSGDLAWICLEELELLPATEQRISLSDLYDADKRRRDPRIRELGSTQRIPHPLNNVRYAATGHGLEAVLDGEQAERPPGEQTTAISRCRHANRHTAGQACIQDVRATPGA